MALKGKYKNRLGVGLCLMLLASVLVACGQEQVQDSQTVSIEQTKTQDFQAVGTEQTEEPNQTQEPVQSQISQSVQDLTSMTILEDGSIAEQTFEVELSEYDGKVTFVPYVPNAENPVLHMEIKQEGEVLTTIKGYVPEALKDAEFVSLDAVSFYDVNYDNYTDIVLVETYGDTTFMAIYEGFPKDAGDYDNRFFVRAYLSEVITEELNKTGDVSVSGLRNFLSDGKKNGSFASYQEAYEMVSRLEETEYDQTELEYNLIYFDEDDIPELVVGKNGYYVSLYTYRDGSVSMLMDHWAYGAMGNMGYEYAPGKNNLRNYNTDYAGAVLYTTYMTVDENCSLETVAEIVTYHFDDVNQNGMPDEEEMDSMGLYGVTYVNGVEELSNESAAYDAGEYEFILGDMSLEELKERL